MAARDDKGGEGGGWGGRRGLEMVGKDIEESFNCPIGLECDRFGSILANSNES